MNRFRSNEESHFGRRACGLLVAIASGFAAFVQVGCTTAENKPEHEPAAASRHEHDGADAHAHHGTGQSESELIVATTPAPARAGEPTRLRLMIHRPDGSMVDAFDVSHEKQVHLIVVRDGLDEFAHLHPAVDAAGNIQIEHTFPVGGVYFVYADHKPQGELQSTARAKIEIEGETPLAAELIPDIPGEVASEDLRAVVSVATTGDSLAKSIAFDLRDSAGRPVSDLEPYLGAMGHLVILSADGAEYVHAHPADEPASDAGRVTFEAHFTKGGLYKGWGQFQRAGKVSTVPFVLNVE